MTKTKSPSTPTTTRTRKSIVSEIADDNPVDPMVTDANIEDFNSNDRLYGLHLSGIVADRTKRMIPKDNPTTEVVTYNVIDEDTNRHYYVDDYAPGSYFDVGEYITVPVYVKPYRKKNNDLTYMLSIQKEFRSSVGIPF